MKNKGKNEHKQQIAKYQHLIFIISSHFSLLPQLPTVDDVLPHHITTWPDR